MGHVLLVHDGVAAPRLELDERLPAKEFKCVENGAPLEVAKGLKVFFPGEDDDFSEVFVVAYD